MKNLLKNRKEIFANATSPFFQPKLLRSRPSAGERETYARFYQNYFRSVYQYLRRRLGGNREAAEDLAQEAFVRIFERLPAVKRHSLASYLFDSAESLLKEYEHAPHDLPLSEPLLQ